jgi:peroxiredoxin
MLKRAGILLAILTLGLVASRSGRTAAETAKVDQAVKDFALTDLWTEKPVKLSSLKGKPVVIVFISYNCDTTWRYEKRIGQLMKNYGQKGVKFLAVRSSAHDTVEQTKKYCEAKNFTMPVLYDEKNTLADYFQVRVTPTFFVVDGKGTLRYGGSCDNNREEPQATKTFVKDALDAVLADKPVPVKQTDAFG